MRNKKGFTLLEILLVVAALSILASITIVAINPNKQLADTRNAQRRSDINTILSAIYQYSIDQDGDITPLNIDAVVGTSQVIGNLANCNLNCAATATEAACLDLRPGLVEDYIVDLPRDPGGGSVDTPAAGDYYTDYFVNLTNGRITIGVCDPEGTDPISVRR